MDKNYKDIIKKEYVRCANDPVYFLKKYSFIQHPIKCKIPFSLTRLFANIIAQNCV